MEGRPPLKLIKEEYKGEAKGIAVTRDRLALLNEPNNKEIVISFEEFVRSSRSPRLFAAGPPTQKKTLSYRGRANNRCLTKKITKHQAGVIVISK